MDTSQSHSSTPSRCPLHHTYLLHHPNSTPSHPSIPCLKEDAEPLKGQRYHFPSVQGSPFVCAHTCMYTYTFIGSHQFWEKRTRWLDSIHSAQCYCWYIEPVLALVLDKSLVTGLLLWKIRCCKVEVLPYSILESMPLRARRFCLVSFSLGISQSLGFITICEHWSD